MGMDRVQPGRARLDSASPRTGTQPADGGRGRRADGCGMGREGPDRGTLVWVVMVTGLRRAELLALRWADFDLDRGTLYVRRNHVRVARRNVEKDTKTHRARRLAIDETTVQILGMHRQRYEERCREISLKPSPTAYLFSYSPTIDRPCDPSGVTHRYGRMCRRVGIDSHLHALRHYSATELLATGVDRRPSGS